MVGMRVVVRRGRGRICPMPRHDLGPVRRWLLRSVWLLPVVLLVAWVILTVTEASLRRAYGY